MMAIRCYIRLTFIFRLKEQLNRENIRSVAFSVRSSLKSNSIWPSSEDLTDPVIKVGGVSTLHPVSPPLSPSTSMETSVSQVDISKAQIKPKKPPITQKVAAPRSRKPQNGSKK